MTLSEEYLLRSYGAMLETTLVPEKRNALWKRAAKLFPELSNQILEKFESIDKHENPVGYHHMVGVSFMFLAMVNSLQDEPIIDWDQILVDTTQPELLPKKKFELPSFGYLKPIDIE